mgnify:CR=1 FL=1
MARAEVPGPFCFNDTADTGIYTLEVGKAPEYLRLYEREGLAIQEPILGNLIGYFSSEIGDLNLIVHMWGYESYEERTRRRAELVANEGWKAYVEKVRPFILRQENRILIPAPTALRRRVLAS